jgi:hypothetical protein
VLLVEPTWEGAHEPWYRVTGPASAAYAFAWRPISGDSVEISHYHGAPVRIAQATGTGRRVLAQRATILEYLVEGTGREDAWRISGRWIPCGWFRDTAG